MIGSKLAHYEITNHLGTGGMGEVYQATDSKLGRSVAIKLLPEAFSRDADRLARFEREARVLASVNHPHIAAIYGLEEFGGRKFLVMELAAGETLADRISRGPIPLDHALKIANQIAEALEAAHEKGVMHRDLKPANIKVSADGHVKVLDFGLAKAFEGEGGISNLSNSPTMSLEVTRAGVILGTAAYMSPEQAKGRTVDKRTDIFAFGVVLYEMLTGERLHRGESVSEVLAEVIKETPDLKRVPAKVRPLLRSCLQKDPSQRLHDIADAKLLLDVGGSEVEASKQANGKAWIWPAVAAILLLITVALGVKLFRTEPPAGQEVRSSIDKPENLKFNAGTQATISPNGLWLAFPAEGPDGKSRMYVRNVASLEVKPLPGSEGIIPLAPPPFWTYDSRFVLYGAAGRLMKSDVTDGTPAQSIADTGQPLIQGGAENRDGVILYSNVSGNLMQVPEGGGTPVAATTLDSDSGEIAHRWPQFLPDGRRFLYLRVFPNSRKTGIYVGSLDKMPGEQDSKLLLLTNRQAYWVTSEANGKSFLLFQQEANLLARPFDSGTPGLTGTAVLIADDVGSYANATSGLWNVSRTGRLFYRSGGSALPQLTWRDSEGKPTGVIGEPNTYGTPAISGDGKKVAFRMEDAQGNSDIYVRNITGGSNDVHLTHDTGFDTSPVFSPDNKTIIFGANRGSHRDLYEINADGSGGEKLLYTSGQDKTPSSWSNDGFLLFTSTDPKNKEDLWVLPVSSPLNACLLLGSKDREGNGQFSPNGTSIAYQSNQLVSYQIFVRPFSPASPCPADPATGFASQISRTYSIFPQWSSNGKRLFFIGENAALLAAEILSGSNFGTPQPIFNDVDQTTTYAVTLSGDRDRFLFVQQPVSTRPQPPFILVQNWLASMKK